MGTLHERQYTFLIISRSVLPRIRNVSDKLCTVNQNTHFVFSNSPPPAPENLTVYEIMWKTIVEQDRPHMTMWHMCIACWIPKATHTRSQCVILIAFRLHQWLHELTSKLHYTYISSHIYTCKIQAVCTSLVQ